MRKIEVERSFWNYYAKSYDNLAKYYEPYKSLVKEVCEHIDDFADGRSIQILDAGCGTGNYVIELMQHGHKIIGIDNSDVMLSLAKNKVSRLVDGQPPKILQHDLNEPLPFKKESFNAIISIHALFTLHDHIRFLNELKRVANNTSMIIIVNSSDKLTMREAIGRQLKLTKGFNKFLSLIPLLMVGFWNIILSTRQSNNYRITTEEELIELLEYVGAKNIKIFKTYVSSIMAIGYLYKN